MYKLLPRPSHLVDPHSDGAPSTGNQMFGKKFPKKEIQTYVSIHHNDCAFNDETKNEILKWHIKGEVKLDCRPKLMMYLELELTQSKETLSKWG